ncbi:MAG: YdcF family protein [Cyanobacteria bacterium P01_G01_bin.49]
MTKFKLDLKSRLAKKKRTKIVKLVCLAAITLILSSLVLNVLVRSPISSRKPVDGILVLGGSIRREIYAAKLARKSPELPIIISQGSKAPCIKLIFQQKKAPIDQVLLERCAQSTFDNFFFCVPLLNQKGIHKVKLITSEEHLPRAKWLSQIHLAARGIAVEVDAVKEIGVPGNEESPVKTFLDVARSLIWTIFSQVIQPPCFDVIPLTEVDLSSWYEKGFECEHQGNVLSENVGVKTPPKNTIANTHISVNSWG